MSCNSYDLRLPTTPREGFPGPSWERRTRSSGSSFQSNRQNQGEWPARTNRGVLLTVKLRMHRVRLRSSRILIPRFRFDSPAIQKYRSKPPAPRSVDGSGNTGSGGQVIENASHITLHDFPRNGEFQGALLSAFPSSAACAIMRQQTTASRRFLCTNQTVPLGKFRAFAFWKLGWSGASRA
jgi:hypothetical protein